MSEKKKKDNDKKRTWERVLELVLEHITLAGIAGVIVAVGGLITVICTQTDLCKRAPTTPEAIATATEEAARTATEPAITPTKWSAISAPDTMP